MLLKMRRKPFVPVVLFVGLLLVVSTIFSQMNQTAQAQASKVKICHNFKVIEVSENALDAHLNHGDCLAEEDAEKEDPCECEDEVLVVILEGVVSSSTLDGVVSGDSFSIEFMLDTGLADQDPSPDRGFFIDPWYWHFIVGDPWDWLFGFTVEVLPGESAGDDVMFIKAVFDNPEEDMVMGLELGSQFVTTLVFEAGTLNGDSLPGARAFPCKSGNLQIIDENDELRFVGTITGGQAE